jgi:SM-20-related protein
MSLSLIQLENLEKSDVITVPYKHMVAHNAITDSYKEAMSKDFPEIKNPGFFHLETMELKGVFKQLIDELNSPELSEVLSNKLNVELRDKPKLITVRKWSAKKDGRIHNDGESKIVTALFYLNDSWSETEDGGRFRVLASDRSFDDTVTEVAPNFGEFVVFVRSDNSWHGHKPFVGERRVVQITWLKSQEHMQRKQKRGRLSFFLKKIFG